MAVINPAQVVSPGGPSGAVQYNNGGVFGGIASGTAGQILTSNGAGATPAFKTPFTTLAPQACNVLATTGDLTLGGAVGDPIIVPVYATSTANAFVESIGATNTETYIDGQYLVLQNVSGATGYSGIVTPISLVFAYLAVANYGLTGQNSNGAYIASKIALNPGGSATFLWNATDQNWIYDGPVPYALQTLYTPGSYSFVIPAGAKAVRIRMQGGGGGGGGGSIGTNAGGGGGGGSGGYSEFTLADAATFFASGFTGITMTLVAGAAGVGGSGGANGTAGGDTSVSFTDGSSNAWVYTVKGGSPGTAGSTLAGGVGGAGGAASCGTINVPGVAGGNGGYLAVAATTGANAGAFGGSSGGGGGGNRNGTTNVGGAAAGAFATTLLTRNGSSVPAGTAGGTTGATKIGGNGTSIYPIPGAGGTGGGGGGSVTGSGTASIGGTGGTGAGGGGGGCGSAGSGGTGGTGGNGYIEIEVLG